MSNHPNTILISESFFFFLPMLQFYMSEIQLYLTQYLRFNGYLIKILTLIHYVRDFVQIHKIFLLYLKRELNL